MTKRIDYISTPHRSTIVTRHRVTRQTRIKRHLYHSLPLLFHGKGMKNEREKLEKRSRGHRTSNNRAMFKAAGRVGGKTARLFPSEIAFSPKQLFRTFVAWRITKKEEKKKNSPLVRDKYADAQRKSCTTPSPSDGIQFGIRYKQRRRRRSRSSFVQRRQTKRNSPKRGLTRRE